MIYDLLAPIYDSINSDIDYSKWADFIEKIISRNFKGKKADLVLDLGCGTGSMTLELARRGYDMTGVDYSCEMLDIARNRAIDEGLSEKMLWLCQDMTEFELYGTVDVTVSCLDSLNHLIGKGDLERCFKLVHNYLNPDGLFIFDINGKYKFENIYADNSYVIEEDGSFCVWQNYYDERSKLCDFYITLFKEDRDGRYQRYDEVQTERMYTLRTVKSLLGKCSFELIGVYSDFDFTEGTDNNERLYVAARCIKKEVLQ